MNSNRQTLLKDIKALQLLIPGDHYKLYIKQAQQKNLKFISKHEFFPAMDEKSPRSLNDIELNVLSSSKRNYMDNIFLPSIVEKQASTLIDKPGEQESSAVNRWTEMIKKAQTAAQLMAIIKQLNQRRKSSANKTGKQKSLWKRILGQ